ncbi:DNA-binding transcriptional regulator GalS [Paraphotobacterium marinum]|uniref:DNA-binding transcriptional regulator GalS n=1 Tax=Paraphotobacterium marinum TaxID=1755811 RepID=A0A220VFV1_9GAMM|nr:LacI family DNA-binding transcriptional regulator [Paraphotobacterium marinum]ASK79264.1 DNA-binding transcriptional regulator GalS [Paraphotobacterium marinum]
MPNIKDVAQKAGVSIATVSRVLNNKGHVSNLNKQLVEKAIGELDYQPNSSAQALVRKKSKTIGILVRDMSDPFFGQIIKAIDDIAMSYGYDTLIGNGFHERKLEMDVIDFFLRQQCEYFIIHSQGLTDIDLKNISQKVKNLIIINRNVTRLPHQCVYVDQQKGTYLATKYLLSHGHKHIAYLNSLYKTDTSDERKNGYLRAMKEYDITNCIVKKTEPNHYGGVHAMKALLDEKKVSAVICFNDRMATGVISYLHSHNIKIPKQISVIGFDNINLATQVYPKLTTINYPMQQIAEYATKVLLGIPTNKIDFKLDLVHRDSVYALKH